MKKILFLAVLALALVAVPAFASVQNVKVSGEIDSTFVSRSQFDLGDTATKTGQSKQNLFITQTTLNVDADLTDKVSATVGLINERPWGDNLNTATPQVEDSKNDIDLNVAYVTIKEMLYSPLTVVVGRQKFAYGNSFVISSSGTNNNVATGGLNGVAEDLTKRTAMDAIRAILDYNPLTIDLVYAKIDSNNLLSTGNLKDDIDLYGTNVNYKLGDKYDSVLEAYFWAKVDNSLRGTGFGGQPLKADTVYMPGVHASTNVLDGLMLSGEIAWQKGNSTQLYNTAADDNLKRDAFGYQAVAVYKLPFEKTKAYSPVLTTAWTYLSGDKNPTEVGKRTANKLWDPMFENQGGGKIYNALFNLQNCQILTVKGAVKPIEDVTASAEWNGLWLAQEIRTAGALTLQQPDGVSFSPATRVNGGKALGNEFDLGLSYAYTEDVTIGASVGLFAPGKVFTPLNNKSATQALVNMDVKF